MSRVGNTSNLENNSRYDILIFDYPEGYPTGRLAVEFGKTPKKISGIQKISQVFLKTLMTGVGTDVVHQLSGTEFQQFSGSSYNIQINNGQEINSAISEAVRKAESQTKNILNTPLEGLTSQLETAQIINVDQDGEVTTVRVRLISKAGERAPIALPFTSLGLRVNT